MQKTDISKSLKHEDLGEYKDVANSLLDQVSQFQVS